MRHPNPESLLLAVCGAFACFLWSSRGDFSWAVAAFLLCLLNIFLYWRGRSDKKTRLWSWGKRAKRKPEVLLDIDGVVADFLRDALPIIERVVGEKYAPEDFSSWDIFEVIGKDREAECWTRINVRGFYLNLSPYYGAVEGVEQLKKIADVHVVTAMASVHSEHAYYERAEWIQKHLNMTEHDVTFSSKKEKINGDILVDDKVLNVLAWAKAHPKGVGIIWDQPYNRLREKLPLNVRRAYSWDDVIREVESL